MTYKLPQRPTATYNEGFRYVRRTESKRRLMRKAVQMGENMRSSGRGLWVFLFFLVVLSAAADALIVHNHHETAALSRFIMWCPGFAALLSCWALQIPMTALGWQWPPSRFLRIAYVLPLLYAAPTYFLTWVAIRHSFEPKSFVISMATPYGLDRWPMLGTFAVAMPLTFTITVIGTMIWTLGEELGWRGFLFPRLQSGIGFHGACLLSGGIWAVWHYPSLLWADYNAGTNAIFAISCFTVMVVAMGYIMGWLRARSSSVWPCVVLHATHNTFVQVIFDPLTSATGRSKYITTEFGAGLATAMVVTAIVIVSAPRPYIEDSSVSV